MFPTQIKPLLNSIIVNCLKASVRKFTPRRALMYVPADDIKKVEKSFTLDVDCITLDCEDGVALNKKTQARSNIRKVLDRGKPKKQRKYDFAVRVNSVSSGILKDDLNVIVTGKNLPDTLLLPKVEKNEDLQLFAGYLKEYIKSEGQIGVILGIESAVSLINAVDICKFAKELSKSAKFFPVALLFGSDDFLATIGARRSPLSTETLYARQKIVTVAKAFDLQAIDLVYIDYKDTEGLKRQAEEGAQFGFTGKQVIHPGQLEVTQNAFIPTDKQIEWATAVLTAFHEHQQEGKGAFAYKGQMIDMPTVKQAQNIVDLINVIMMHKH